MKAKNDFSGHGGQLLLNKWVENDAGESCLSRTGRAMLGESKTNARSEPGDWVLGAARQV